MRKIYVLGILFLCGWMGVKAQTTANYTFATNATGSLALDRNGNTVDMTTGTTSLLAAGLDATASALQTNSFDIFFMGTRFTQFSVNDDGVLQLGGTVVGTNLYTLTGGTTALPQLSAFNADMRTGKTTGKVTSKVVGTAPNRCLVVEFNSMQLFYQSTSVAGTSTWQMRIYESTGIIEYMYGAMNVSVNGTSTQSPSIGFYTGAASGASGSVQYAGSTYSSTTYAANPSIAATGNIANLNSAANGSRRTYTFIPPGNVGNTLVTSLAPPTGITFTNVNPGSMTVNWNAASPLTGVLYYAIYISTDGITYTYNTQFANTVNSVSYSGMTPATTYYFKIYSLSEGDLSTALSGSQITAPCPVGAKNFTIDNTLPQSSTNFPSFTSAINYLNGLTTCTLSGAITFNVVSGQTFTENTPIITGIGSATYPIIFQKSGVLANPVLQPTGTAATGEFGIAINGCKNITFDGIDISAVGSNTEYGYYVGNISATTGSQNITIKNSAITLSRANANVCYGIIQNTSSFPATSAAGANSNNKYYNLTIKNVYSGINLIGTVGFPDQNCEIGTTSCATRNIIGDPATANDIGNGTTTVFGIKALNQAGIKIFNNDVNNVTTTGAGIAADGIWLEYGTPGNTTVNLGTSDIYNNKISGIACTTTGTTAGAVARGIRVNTNANASSITRVYNNFISNIQSSTTNATLTVRKVVGIALQPALSGGGSTINCEFNSVNINAATLVNSNACLEIGTTAGPGYKVRNNIFANTTAAQAGSAKHYTWVTGSATSIGASSISNYNDLYVANTTNGYVGLGATTDYATLANWRSGITTPAGIDANSISTDPQFTSATDLHASAIAVNGAADPSYATNTPFVTVDIDCTTRPSPTDIGADEFNVVSDDAGVTNVAAVAAAPLCAGAQNFTVTYKNFGLSTLTSVTINYKVNGGAVTSIPLTGLSIGAGATGTTTISVTLPSSITATSIQAYTTLPNGNTDGNSTNDSYTNSLIYTGLSGTYTVGASADFSTLNGTATAASAIYYANTYGVCGPITLNLLSTYPSGSEVFPITINVIPGASATNTVTVKPSTTATVSGSINNNAIFKLNGTDYFTIDGSNSGGTDQSLTITNAGTGTASGVWLASQGVGAGATFNTIKNCIINCTGGSGINSGIQVAGTTVTTNGADNDNTTIQNNAITTGAIGIYAFGTAAVTAGGNDNLLISGNTITTSTSNTTSYGIEAGNDLTSSIIGNTISVTTSGTTAPVAISLETGFVSSSVTKNKITSAYTSATGGYGGRGITIGTGTATSALTVSNNFIAGVNGGSNESSFGNSSAMGISIGVIGNSSTLTTIAGGINIYHNSINMAGTHSRTSATVTAALYVGSAATALDVRNNIFVNSLNNTTTAGSKDYAVYSAATSSPFTTIDYNDYYGAGSANSTFVFASANAVDEATLVAMQGAFSGDTHSVNIAPAFTSVTDLHLPSATNLSLNDLGDATVGITTDIDGDTRPASGSTKPDMGADEFTVPACTGAVGGTAAGSVVYCASGTPAITASGYSTGLNSGYQWQYSNDNFSTDINDFTGQTNPATLTTGIVSSTTYYRLKVTCPSGTAMAFSTIVTITVNSLPATVIVTGAGTFCTSTTITAANGSDGTMYFQGTTSGGTSTATPSNSQSITTSGTYYFRAQSAAGCWSVEGSAVVVIQTPITITPTPASICKGASGTLAATSTCAGFINSGTAFSGTWNAATDPIALKPTTSISNTATCSFDATVTRNYSVTTFQVSVAGTYTFQMNNDINFDGMAYIVTGPFVPGNCSGGGTWIKGDDDGGSNEPLFTAALTTGTTYSIISTTYSSTSGTYTGSYAYTVTPPSGGQILLQSSGTIQWYAAASGGSSIGSGSPFNPVGVVGSPLANTNTAGTTTFYVACSNASACRTPVNFVINPDANAGTVSGTSPLCVGAGTTTYTVTGAVLSGGTGAWSSTVPGVATVNAATGVVTIVGAGSTNITYTITGGCSGTVSSFQTLNVSGTPTTSTNGGNVFSCKGSTSAALGGSTPTVGTGLWTVTAAPGGGSTSDITFTSSTTGNTTAIVAAGAVAGNYTLQWTISNSPCTPSSSTLTLTVNPNAAPGTVSGASPICVGGTATTYSVAGAVLGGGSGAWSSDNTGVATVNSSTGAVTGVAQGTANIIYTITGGCGGTVTSQQSVTVQAIDYANLQFPASGTICSTGSLTAYGQVYEPGITPPAGASVNITVQIGYNNANTDPATWPAGNWTNATYNTQVGNNDEYMGAIGNGFAPGTYYYTFRYSLNGCTYQYGGYNSGFWNGTSNVNGVLTVSPNATAGTVTAGTSPICIGATSTYTVSGNSSTGAWSSSNTGIATVNSSTGVVTGTGAGTANIIYTVNTGCGAPVTAQQTIMVSANATAGTISGVTPICIATPTTFTVSGSSAAGTWSSSNTSVATVTSGGVVTGVAQGTANIIYTVSTGCNSPVTATYGVTVQALDYANLQFPASGTICASGTFTAYGQVYEPGVTPGAGQGTGITVQFGYNTTNNDPSTWPAGNWSNAAYNPGPTGSNDEYIGTVSGLTAGTTYYYTFRYSLNGCGYQYGGYSSGGGGFWNGTSNVSGILTVSPNANAGTVSGTSPLCVLGTATYTSNGDAGGTWSSTNTLVATVNSGTGVVTALTPGSTNITYTVNSGCGAPVSSFKTLNVTVLPNAGTLSGTQTVCAGTTTTFTSNGDAGGTFTSSNTSIATVNASTGVVTGVGTGTATITYTVASPCAGLPATATRTVTVDADTWLGGSSDWFTAANWSCGIPTTLLDVVIPAGMSNYPAVTTGSALAHNITVASGASVTVSGAGIFSLYGTITNNGTFDLTAGTLDLAGAGISFGGSQITAGTVKNLTISNSGSSSISSAANDSVKVTNYVSFNTSGNTFNTGGNLTLVSSAANTASVTDITHNGATALTGNSIAGNVSVERYFGVGRKWRYVAVNTLAATGSKNTFQQNWMEGQVPGVNGGPSGYGLWITGVTGTGGGFDAYTSTPAIKWWNGSIFTGITDPTTYDMRQHPAYYTYVRGDRSATGINSTVGSTVLRTFGSLVQGDQAGVTIPAGTVYVGLGNPYPSAIDLTRLTFTGTAEPIAIAVWDPFLAGANGLGGYQYLTRSPGDADYVITPGGGSYPQAPFDPMDIIESGQGFFIQGGAANHDLGFTEVSKTPHVYTPFFTAGHEQKMQGILSVRNADGSVTVVDGVQCRMNYPNLTPLDPSDVRKLGNGAENASIVRENTLLAVEYRNMAQLTDTIQLNLSGLGVKNYRWTINMTNLDSPGRLAYLVDRYTVTETLLNAAGSNTIDFNVVNIPGSYAPNRFLIVFRPGGVVPVTLTTISAVRQSDKTIMVNWKTENETGINHYEVTRSATGVAFNTIGNSNPTNNAGSSAAYSLVDVAPLGGDNYYRIKALSDNGQIQYSGIVKVGPIGQDASITVYPNPITNGIINLKFENEVLGKYQIQLSDKSGRTIHTETITVSSGNEVKTLNLGHRLAAGAYDLTIIGPDGKKTRLGVVAE